MNDGSVMVTDSSGQSKRYPTLGQWWRDESSPAQPVQSKPSDDAEWDSLMADLRKFTA
jgi:hypothetical protein